MSDNLGYATWVLGWCKFDVIFDSDNFHIGWKKIIR